MVFRMSTSEFQQEVLEKLDNCKRRWTCWWGMGSLAGSNWSRIA